MNDQMSVAVIASQRLEETHSSLLALAQTARNTPLDVQVIATDGASPDWPRLPFAVRVLTVATHLSPGERLNSAVSAARGEFVMFLPAGALLETFWPQALHAAFARPDVAAAVPRIVDTAGSVVRACGAGVQSGRLAHVHAGSARDAVYVLRPVNLDLAPLCGMTLRRAHLAQVRGFDAAFPATLFDVDWTLRARVERLRIVYRPDYTVRYDGPLPLGFDPAERSSAQHFMQRWGTVFSPPLQASVFLP